MLEEKIKHLESEIAQLNDTVEDLKKEVAQNKEDIGALENTLHHHTMNKPWLKGGHGQ